MGWNHLYQSWRHELPEVFEEDQKKVIDQLVNVVVQPCIDYVRNECKEQTPTEDQCIVVGFLRIMTAMLRPFSEGHHADADKKQKQHIIEQCFLFAATWSLCCTINTEFRKPFSQRFKDICNGDVEGQEHKLKNKVLPSQFDRGTIFDWRYMPEANEWKNWMDFTKKDEVDNFPKNAVVQEIIVTTMDTIRYGALLELFVQNDIRTLFVGPTGTGKTAYIQKVLHQTLPPEKFLIIECGFSAQTHCN
jgi:dynein heavy chain